MRGRAVWIRPSAPTPAIAPGVRWCATGCLIYGVISYIVSLRIREIGIRLALGAQMAVLRRMLMGRVLALVAAGLALGLAGAAMLARLMETLVFGITPHDPVTYAQVSAILGLTAICAGYLPARRITRIDPASALRAE